jgi:transglutaminase-like putative cysteine protease
MSRTPPLIPGRRIPPPPPPRNTIQSNPDPDSAFPSIAARLQRLNLDLTARNGPVRPPPPRRERITSKQEYEMNAEENERIVTTASAARRESAPPPLPPRRTHPNFVSVIAGSTPDAPDAMDTPPPPPRRIVPPIPKSPSRAPPPPPVRLPPPPPEPEPEQEVHERIDEMHSRSEQLNNVVAEERSRCLKCRDFSQIDAHAAFFPRQNVSSLQTLAHALTSPFPSETEKARAIFTWLHHNIAYDTAAFFSGQLTAATAESTLRSGLAVCEGYAGLYETLASLAGLDCIKISGHGKGVSHVPFLPGAPIPNMASNHAWNAILMDGEWRLIDACWGSGALQGRVYVKGFNPSWFTCTSVEFAKRHFPADPGDQLIAEEDGGPVSWEEYITAPEGPVIFSDFHRLDYHADYVQPSTKYVQGGQRVAFRIRKRCQHMSTDEGDNYVSFIALADGQRVPMQLDEGGGWSAEVFVPAADGEVMIYYVSRMDGKEALGLGMQNFNRYIGRRAMELVGFCQWTVLSGSG